MKDLIEDLIKLGYSVSYTKRKDGGYRITKINGVGFTGSKGNAEARRILGVSLSPARSKQLNYIRTPKGRWGNKKKSALPTDLKKKLQSLQRKWRRKGKKKGDQGMPSTSGIRYTLEHEGYEEAFNRLTQNERYLLGFAYEKNVDWLISRIERESKQSGISDEWQVLINLIKDIKSTFKEDWIQDIYEILGSPPISTYISMSERDKIKAIMNVMKS